MRSYGQFCSMARALDCVGDRWTLLIVRELLTQGPSRYSDLRRGLPGIASNLLADRIRDMEADGLIVRHDEPPPVAASLIRLTDRGRDLSGVVRELTRWGAPLMRNPQNADEFRMHWFSLPLRHLCRDGTPDEPASTVRFGDRHDGCDVIANQGTVTVGPCSADHRPDSIVGAPPRVLVGIFTGQLSVRQAVAQGLTVDGSMKAFQRILPKEPIDA
jgi:DNA-binding HxlR family transcriptional regulator/putative sterol carrier protein